ncbi:PAS domain-containing protein [Pseudorhodoferax sp.]|uniref:PAS domain-containing protein n=1 Tax=Pseudorhodoferax sp. TaxID=1993553 RepID=UPI002DD68381|nr:PAS domain-containing protein [Pseudorhodoferax sp.]
MPHRTALSGTASAPRLLRATQLHGRAPELAALHAAFGRVAGGGRAELVLIGGAAGAGKSALAHALLDALPAGAALAAVGKADQFHGGQPLAPLAQALRALAGEIAVGPRDAFAHWQGVLRAAVDAGTTQVLGLVPQLEALLGPPPAAGTPAPRNTLAFVHDLLRRLLQAFARPGQPLLLVLDDLHWADQPLLDFLAHLLTEPATAHLLVLGTWREHDTGAEAVQALRGRLQAAGAQVRTLALAPLTPHDTAALVADLLERPAADAGLAALAARVHADSAGNPLFARQFVTELAERGLLQPGSAGTGWQWQDAGIAAAVDSGSLAALVHQRLARLPTPTAQLLQQLACLGHAADSALLAHAARLSLPALRLRLQPAIAAGLAQLKDGQCAFVHDRVREAAYDQLAAPARARLHQRLAHSLLDQASPAERMARIFAIADQLRQAQPALRQRAEREDAAEIHLLAAQRARLAAAYPAAARHVQHGLVLLGPGHWERRHTLSFELHRLHAECALLDGALDEAQARLEALLPHGSDAAERAGVYRLLVVLHSLRADYARAVDCALQALAPLGLVLPAHPAQADVDRAYATLQELLDGREIATLVELPRATDRHVEAAMDVLSELFAPACFTNERLALLHLCRMVELSLRHGLGEASAQGLAWFGLLLGHHYGRHRDALRFARLGQAIVARHHLRAYEAKALFAREIASGWCEPLDQAVRLARAAFTAGTEGGDVLVACFSCHHLAGDMLVRGSPLAEVLAEIDAGLAYVQRAGFADVADELRTQQRFVLALQGRTAGLDDWGGHGFDAAAFEQSMVAGRMPTMVFWYWLLRAQAHFLAGHPGQAAAALARADGWAWSSPVHIQAVHHAFYSALVQAALEHDGAADAGRRAHIAAMRQRLARWCRHCPANFADKLALVDAELARLDGRLLDAARLYEQAAGLARTHGFVQNEALAHELAARCHAQAELPTASEAHWRQAHATWHRWGAQGKLRQLELALPWLAGPAAAAPAPPLELPMVRAAQQLSGEIDRQRLAATLLRLALEHAGAERGVLLLAQDGRWQVQAQALLQASGVQVREREGPPSESDVPAGLLQYVERSHQRVLLHDAQAAPPLPFALPADTPQRALLALPLVRQGRLTGLLYLEHRHAGGVFTPQRLTLLELLAAQAAISLESARLYAELLRENRERRDAEREHRRVQAALADSELRFRRMADATPDVLWITELVPERVVYVSPSFERVWGRTAEDLYRDPRVWTQCIHADDRGAVEHAFVDWIDRGASQPWAFEFRVVQPSGAVRWVHDRGVMISDGATRRVTGLATDITERKLAEEALRESESRFALAVAGANDGIWDWDIVRDQLFMSERAQLLYGLEPSAPVRTRAGWVAAVRQHPEDQALRNQRMQAYLAGETDHYDGEYRVLYPDGLYHWLRIRGQCVRDAGGRATRLAGSVSDIDAHKRAEAALRQSQRLEAVGTLAGGIAHDFNNILGAILGFGEMARAGTRAGSRARRDVEFILTAGERGRALVERILAFSRTGLSERVPVHVEGVARESLQLLAATLPATVQVRQQLAAGTAAVLGDATQLHQVLMNLLGNALQAMPEGGTLEVALAPRRLVQPHLASTGTLPAGEYVALAVADSGCGIAPEHLARIFDPFFTTREAGAGTGLGLSLVHGIVAEFGGAVDVQSTPGTGSRFTVLLPRAGDAPAAPDGRRSTAPPRGLHEQVLVVDDEPALLQLATRRLAELGYVPVGFACGAEALAAFSAHPERFDAVLTDERMPGLSGTELVRALRAVRARIPVVLLTGYRGADVVQRARSAGADAVLGKPLAREQLARTLAELLAAARGGPPAPP